VNRNESTKELGAEHLHDQDNGPDDHECRICEYAVEDIDLIINFPCTDHIEDLHEDE